MPSSPTQVTPSSNVYLNAIQWGGWEWTDGGGAGTNITYYFGAAGTDLTSVFGASYGTSVAWTAGEQASYQAALQTWANVANITFTQVFSYGQADLVEYIFDNSGSSILGVHETPQSAAGSDGTAWGAYNLSGSGFDASGLLAGGYGFITFVHELGHALGLAHPHDNGGGSGTFPGVTSGDSSDLGDNNLNQGIFSLMSYNDGWRTVMGLPWDYGLGTNSGWQSGPMAFDIAAIQYLYGANMSYHTGNDTYVLGHAVGRNDQLSCIWDAGGTDNIVYNGSYSCTIDLRPATLADEAGGGGFVSWANGAPTSSLDHWNAFTIAAGVVIENATGGSGGDSIYLSSANVNNTVNGNGGTDTVYVTYNQGSGYTIQAGSTASNLVMIGSAGTDTLQNCEWVHFANGTTVATSTLISSPANDASHDFNGNGTSDILWYNTSNYAVGQFIMNNGVATWAGVGSGGAAWQIAGAGDFNGNGTDDILWYNASTGSVGQFVMNSGVASWAGVGWVGSGWQVAGVGDFNGNGTDDILWYNPSTGLVGQFVMNNGVATWAGIGWAGPGWQVAGVGDFNGNGTDDILWYNASSGLLGQFVMNNGIGSWAGIGWAATSWQVAGVGDFNGNGTDDILWYNVSSGLLGQFVMNNGIGSWAGIGWAATSWQIAGVGDYNGNGTDDILWHNASTGQVGQFVMNNGVASWAGIGQMAANWVVV